MTEESTVWLVDPLTGLGGVEGRLTLEDEALVFRPVRREAVRSLPLDQIRRTRRVPGSPVIEVHMRKGYRPSPVALYFVAPPSLESGSSGSPLGTTGRSSRRRLAMVALLRANRQKREEVRGWVRAIEEARSRHGGG